MLENSITLTSKSRIAIDKNTNEFAVFYSTNNGRWHGHTRTWDQLDHKMQSMLRKLGYVTKKEKIIK